MSCITHPRIRSSTTIKIRTLGIFYILYIKQTLLTIHYPFPWAPREGQGKGEVHKRERERWVRSCYAMEEAGGSTLRGAPYRAPALQPSSAKLKLINPAMSRRVRRAAARSPSKKPLRLPPCPGLKFFCRFPRKYERVCVWCMDIYTIFDRHTNRLI